MGSTVFMNPPGVVVVGDGQGGFLSTKRSQLGLMRERSGERQMSETKCNLGSSLCLGQSGRQKTTDKVRPSKSRSGCGAQGVDGHSRASGDW